MGELDEKLRSYIREKVDSREMTVYAVAKSAGMTQIHLARFLNKERDLTLKTANRLCESLGLVLIRENDLQKN